jgi:site-specific DNA-methyltransferase (adenine-specific)
MRQVVRASLPLGRGIVLDPFMGSGATIAASIACGYSAIGLEMDGEYFAMAERAIPRLSKFKVEGW